MPTNNTISHSPSSSSETAWEDSEAETSPAVVEAKDVKSKKTSSAIKTDPAERQDDAPVQLPTIKIAANSLSPAMRQQIILTKIETEHQARMASQAASKAHEAGAEIHDQLDFAIRKEMELRKAALEAAKQADQAAVQAELEDKTAAQQEAERLVALHEQAAQKSKLAAHQLHQLALLQAETIEKDMLAKAAKAAEKAKLDLLEKARKEREQHVAAASMRRRRERSKIEARQAKKEKAAAKARLRKEKEAFKKKGQEETAAEKLRALAEKKMGELSKARLNEIEAEWTQQMEELRIERKKLLAEINVKPLLEDVQEEDESKSSLTVPAAAAVGESSPGGLPVRQAKARGSWLNLGGWKLGRS